ncbi:hypothetical protein [Uliginosibacterium flavum]|uniref:GlsB/YeaQ/YmgE family stress response membrane protein n=1 Tax=Uliginosibacterium flavum TaxID=1396831 RepID=A0ABV2TR49_9RHOO
MSDPWSIYLCLAIAAYCLIGIFVPRLRLSWEDEEAGVRVGAAGSLGFGLIFGSGGLTLGGYCDFFVAVSIGLIGFVLIFVGQIADRNS